MFQFNTEFAEGFGACRDVETTRRLNPGLRSYSQWLEQNRGSLGAQAAALCVTGIPVLHGSTLANWTSSP
jgi:hypothetical protein